MPNWKDFCKDDTDEINNGSTMTRTEAEHIIETCRTMKYAHYIYSKKDYKEAQRVIGDE